MKLLYVGLMLSCFLGRGDGAVYDYSDGPFGPAYWGELDPEWALCSSGLAQSPVNVTSENVLSDSIPGVEFNYTSGATVLQIRDHDLAVLWKEDGGGLYFAGIEFKLIQFHLHFPSEHTVDGFSFPLEMHMVHQSVDTGLLAVVGVLYTDGEADDFLSDAMEALPQLIASEEKETDIGNMTIESMDLGTRYYRYAGSLTTPPCTEGFRGFSWRRQGPSQPNKFRHSETLD